MVLSSLPVYRKAPAGGGAWSTSCPDQPFPITSKPGAAVSYSPLFTVVWNTSHRGLAYALPHLGGHLWAPAYTGDRLPGWCSLGRGFSGLPAPLAAGGRGGG